MRMRTRLRSVWLWGLAAWTAAFALPAAADDVVHFGVVFDGEAPATRTLFNQVKQEIMTLTEGEFDVRFDDDDVLTGDWTADSVNASIEVLLKDPEVDMVLALGPLASHTFCCREVLPKPVIAGIVIDATLQDLPQQNGASGVHNLNYLSFPRASRATSSSSRRSRRSTS